MRSVFSASQEVSKAVTDCGGSGSACATDITGVAAALAQATSDISRAVDDCSSTPKFKCVADVVEGSDEIAKAAEGIAKVCALPRP